MQEASSEGIDDAGSMVQEFIPKISVRTKIFIAQEVRMSPVSLEIVRCLQS